MMTRPKPRIWALVAILLGLAIAALAVNFFGSRAAVALAGFFTSDSDPARYCYTWQVPNGTDQDADDLHVRLLSIVNVSEVYTGVYNTFGPADGTSGYIAGDDVYQLDFSTETVGVGEVSLIGLCSDHPTLTLGPPGDTPSLYWTSGGVELTPEPLFIGMDWDWSNRYHLRLGLINSNSVSVTLLTLNVLDPDIKLALEDLNGDVIPALTPVNDMTGGGAVVLEPFTTSYFDLFFDQGGSALLPDHADLKEPNHPYVIEAVFEPWDDPGNTWALYSQALSPLAKLFLPITWR